MGEDLMRRMLTTAAALAALATPLLAAPSTAAPVEVTIKPGTLKKGPHESGVHLDGKTIHDGAVKVKVNAGRVLLYGRWNQYYVVATGNESWGNVKLVRVAKSGNTKLLVAGIDPFNARLDADADRIAYARAVNSQEPRIGVFDLVSKTEVASLSFPAAPALLDYDQGRVITSLWSSRPKTLTWDTVTDTTGKLNGKRSNFASIAHNLLGFFDRDPQFGGCQVLTRLDSTSDVIWRNCKERIEAASPDGLRLALIPLLSDGIGPSDVMVRKVGGARLAHYSINGWFGRIAWETNTKLLMQSNGATQAALVRCKIAECNRATALSPTPDL
jgi:hypothetical protein